MILRGFSGWPGGVQHVALGVFDGVHLGHRSLIGDLVAGARGTGAGTVAATFDPLPEVAFGGSLAGSTLSTIDERSSLLREAGVGEVAVFLFDAAFAEQTAPGFLEQLASACDVRVIVVGHDFRFGRGRHGDVALLAKHGQQRGFSVRTVEPVRLDGEVVSSTRVRGALRAGDLRAAEALLARRYAVSGTVEPGEQRGRTLGYPTVNVATPVEKVLPSDGIYACWVDVRGTRHQAATSLGTRPTFGGGPRALECHLLDFSGDLYGQRVTVTFVQRLRDEQRFSDAESLVRQIAIDVDDTRAALGSGEGGLGPTR